VVIGLNVRPSIRFGEIFQSLDEIRRRDGIFAFGAEEFRNFVLCDSEVEIGRPIAPPPCCGSSGLGSGVTGAVIVPIEIDIAIIMVVVVIVLWCQVDVCRSRWVLSFETSKLWTVIILALVGVECQGVRIGLLRAMRTLESLT
jgi:hypothetical protein